jgi:hypothetical protein
MNGLLQDIRYAVRQLRRALASLGVLLGLAGAYWSNACAEQPSL